MATSWKSQQGKGEYALQFETDDEAKYKLVEKAAQMTMDGKTIDDLTEVKHGEWICLESAIGLYSCSLCEHKILRAECNYCPDCGAIMDGGKADECRQTGKRKKVHSR